MTTNQFRKALDDLGLSQARAAEWLGISTRAAHGWANGKPIPEPTAKLLRLVVRLGLKPEDRAGLKNLNRTISGVSA